jgi:hypothetical protein
MYSCDIAISRVSEIERFGELPLLDLEHGPRRGVALDHLGLEVARQDFVLVFHVPGIRPD